MQADFDLTGPFEARYLAFLETVSQIRPRLHRYCARMTGSVFDGEDIVQDALFEAYRKLDQFDETRPLSPWLFRIAHNRCIDFLRHRDAGRAAELAVAAPEATMPTEPASLGIGKAVEHLVLTLPPKERACVLLKDVFDYSLEEIAELVESTVGGVKAALKRGRSKLAASPVPLKSSRTADPELTRVLHLYVERFNNRDWNSLRELISADARLRVTDAFAGKLADSPYFGNYERWSMPWRMAVGEVDGEQVVIILQRGADTWTPYSMARLRVIENHIDYVVDYAHCPWVIEAAASVTVSVRSELSRARRILAPAETVIEMNGGANDEVHPRRLDRETRR
jgi:RNA polymerase sigma-70 factor (ECF subfamily)